MTISDSITTRRLYINLFNAFPVIKQPELYFAEMCRNKLAEIPSRAKTCECPQTFLSRFKHLVRFVSFGTIIPKLFGNDDDDNNFNNNFC